MNTTIIKQRVRDRMQIADRGYITPCWISDRSATPKGYTQIGYQGDTWFTHRLAYVAFVGPIPLDLQIDHLCRQHACCNPAHLEAVTNRVNTLRGIGFAARNAAKVRCDKGHEFTADNTYEPPSEPGTRYCRACRREAKAAWTLRNSSKQAATLPAVA